MLFKKDDKVFLLNDVQILGSDYVDEPDDDFTIKDKQIYFGYEE
jgi:flagellar biosynthesis regulator FlbT